MPVENLFSHMILVTAVSEAKKRNFGRKLLRNTDFMLRKYVHQLAGEDNDMNYLVVTLIHIASLS